VNQALLRQMAEDRIRDAEVLIGGQRWAFAYYVAGYAVECALKSCVLSRMIYTGGVFMDKKFAEQCHTHTFGDLIRLAGLKGELDAQLAASAAAAGRFVGFWGTVLLWRETSRYEQKTEPEARAIYSAITDDPDGVLRWIRNYW
jgi:hypothetical protein